MNARASGLLAIFAVCGLALSCDGDADDAKQGTGGSGGHGGAASGSPGKGGSAGTGAAGGGGKSGAHQGAGGGNAGSDEGSKAGSGNTGSGNTGSGEGGNAGGDEGGKTGSEQGGNAGGGEGGSGEVGGDDAIRRARCEAICSIEPTGDGSGGPRLDTSGPCGHYDECVEDLLRVIPQDESACLAAQDALYPCLLELDADKFYCQDEYLGIDFAGYYFCNDAFSAWLTYCR